AKGEAGDPAGGASHWKTLISRHSVARLLRAAPIESSQDLRASEKLTGVAKRDTVDRMAVLHGRRLLLFNDDDNAPGSAVVAADQVTKFLPASVRRRRGPSLRRVERRK
ncbi:hypothetical protein FOZ62_022016, partial [Perkinsus olseni]